MDGPVDTSSTGPSRVRGGTRAGLVVGVGGVAVVEAALLLWGQDLNVAVPALLLLVPVVVAGVVGGGLAALAVTLVAAVGFAMVLPPFRSPRVEVGHDLLALGLFLVVAGVAGGLVAAVLGAERRRLVAELARVEALQQLDADRSALMRSVSHDLRTPLATIRAAASDLRGDVPFAPEARDELLDLVVSEAERLDRIVGNLLSLSRIEAGALQPERQAVDLGELVQACADRLTRVTTGLAVARRIEPDLPLADLDYTQFDQVVANLIENAARHAPAGTTLTMTVQEVGARLRLTVHDDGPGFDPAVRDRLFEPFSAATGAGSSGVGLAICRAIVEAHGGTISVADVDGGGATVVVEVPVRG